MVIQEYVNLCIHNHALATVLATTRYVEQKCDVIIINLKDCKHRLNINFLDIVYHAINDEKKQCISISK